MIVQNSNFLSHARVCNSHCNKQREKSRISFCFPTQEFVTAAVTNKGKKGNWDWWFNNANWYGNSKSLMKANNVIYTLTLTIHGTR